MASSKPAKRRKLNPLPENYSTNQPSNVTKEITGIANLEDDNSTCNVDGKYVQHFSSKRKMSELAKKKSWVVVKIPSELAELEEFFSAAEKHINKEFTNKYNFDVTKEKSLEGRYEWVKIKP